MDYIEKIKREKRLEADQIFQKAMKEADGWGQYSHDKNKGMPSGKDYEAKIRDAQKAMARVIKFKLRDNQASGRQYNDGQLI